ACMKISPCTPDLIFCRVRYSRDLRLQAGIGVKKKQQWSRASLKVSANVIRVNIAVGVAELLTYQVHYHSALITQLFDASHVSEELPHLVGDGRTTAAKCEMCPILLRTPIWHLNDRSRLMSTRQLDLYGPLY
ncbi:MAG: hypothetical protein WA238_01495, partial [Methylocella sp.]